MLRWFRKSCDCTKTKTATLSVTEACVSLLSWAWQHTRCPRIQEDTPGIGVRRQPVLHKETSFLKHTACYAQTCPQSRSNKFRFHDLQIWFLILVLSFAGWLWTGQFFVLFTEGRMKDLSISSVIDDTGKDLGLADLRSTKPKLVVDIVVRKEDSFLSKEIMSVAGGSLWERTAGETASLLLQCPNGEHSQVYPLRGVCSCVCIPLVNSGVMAPVGLIHTVKWSVNSMEVLSIYLGCRTLPLGALRALSLNQWWGMWTLAHRHSCLYPNNSSVHPHSGCSWSDMPHRGYQQT